MPALLYRYVCKNVYGYVRKRIQRSEVCCVGSGYVSIGRIGQQNQNQRQCSSENGQKMYLQRREGGQMKKKVKDVEFSKQNKNENTYSAVFHRDFLLM